MLKLGFAKAYDRVSWVFLFQIMEALGFDQTFISMVKLLFNRASASICVNGALFERFKLARECSMVVPWRHISSYLYARCSTSR
jgi:hypothetical protein